MDHPPRATVGPPDFSLTPRYAGIATFGNLPRLDDLPGGRSATDVAVLGVPFDSGASFRPGARFGPAAVRQASRLLRPYHPGLDVAPFTVQQVVDAGDIGCNPFDIGVAVDEIDQAATDLLGSDIRLITVGGDHTIALPLLRAVARRHGPVALLHFDAHLDTWDTYFGARYTHGTPFRRASEEGLVDLDALSHVGTRGPLYGASDLSEDKRLGFGIVTAMDVGNLGPGAIVAALRERIGQRPLYVSVDVDVLDPAHAPGTGTPEAGGLTSRELLAILRGLAGTQLVAGDIVEVAPAYDHAEITAVAASHIMYELISLMAFDLDPASEPQFRNAAAHA